MNNYIIKHPFVVAFIIYLSTTEFVSNSILLLVLPFILIERRFKINKHHDRRYFFLLIVVLAILNEVYGILFNHIELENILYVLPYFLLTFLVIIITDYINKPIVKWILLFIIFEIAVGVLQYILGVRSFTTFRGSIDLPETNLFYLKNVYGISGNSSGFSAKIFIALLLYYKDKSVIRLKEPIFLAIIIIGLIITFNRTMIIASLIFLFLLFLKDYRINSKKNIIIKLLVLISVLITIYIIYVNYFDIIIQQFYVGRDSLSDASYYERQDIVNYFLSFIKDNPLLGNNSFKLNYTTLDGRVLHAHNSYLQLFANNGLIISSLYLYFVSSYINKQNFIFVIPILITGLAQTSIFWGVSFFDLILFYFLFNIRKDNSYTPTK